MREFCAKPLTLFFGTMIAVALSHCSTTHGGKFDDRSLIGMETFDAIAAAGLTVNEDFLIEEPPSVARAVQGTDRNGEVVELYIRRCQVPFGRLARPQLGAFLEKKVIGVARKKHGGWSSVGEVMLIRAMTAAEESQDVYE